jgi:hypothetical protein
VRLLDRVCGPVAGLSVSAWGGWFGVLGMYLIVGHVLFDDHLDFDGTGVLTCWYENKCP